MINVMMVIMVLVVMVGVWLVVSEALVIILF